MAVQPGGKEYNTFVGGLVTEASELTFPKNASKDEQNFELNRNGSRQRRLGLDYEEDYQLIATGFDSTIMETTEASTYRWEGVGNNPNLNVLVIQLRNKLWFTNMNAVPLSTGLLNGGEPLYVSLTEAGQLDYSTVNGGLVVTNAGGAPLYIEYDVATDTMSGSEIAILIRDFFGVDDLLDVDERPASLTDSHSYNLFNQGWTTANIATFVNLHSVYPSNADIQHLGKDTSDVFDAALLIKQYFGNSPAPRGKHIIDAFGRGNFRSAVSSKVLVLDREEGRPTTSASFGQRLFYSGIKSNVTAGDSRSPSYSGIIFFTKVISTTADLGACYQEADPSSEHISDIIASDGGYIFIPEAKNILKLVSTETSLVVFAENGAWEIFGDTGGFTATTYQVSRITNIGCVGKNTIIASEDSISYWSRGGIYVLSVDKVSGRLKSENISEASIQTFFNEISGVAKQNAIGFFDPNGRKLVWLYNDDDDYDGTSYKFKGNKELVLDIPLKAFYPRVIGELATAEHSPFVVGATVTDDFVTTSTVEKAVVGSDDIIVDGEKIISGGVNRGRGNSSSIYVTLAPAPPGQFYWTISTYNNTSFRDWFSKDAIGVDANAFILTGEELFDDTQRKKEVVYLTMHLKRTETGFSEALGDLAPVNPSSCLVSARWNFSDHANSGQQGTSFQAYRLLRPYQPTDVNDDFNYGRSVISTKNKLRGRGKALNMYISTEADKDLQLLGWGLSTATQVVV